MRILVICRAKGYRLSNMLVVVTEDFMQGGEVTVVIYDTVVMDKHDFTKDENHQTVAFTQAQQSIFVIGNTSLTSEHEPKTGKWKKHYVINETLETMMIIGASNTNFATSKNWGIWQLRDRLVFFIGGQTEATYIPQPYHRTLPR